MKPFHSTYGGQDPAATIIFFCPLLLASEKPVLISQSTRSTHATAFLSASLVPSKGWIVRFSLVGSVYT